MANNAKRYKIRRRRIVLGLVVFLTIIVGSVFLNQYSQYKSLLKQKQELGTELEKVQQENEKLNSDVNYSSTSEFIEYMARQLLGWVKPGEIKYIDND